MAVDLEGEKAIADLRDVNTQPLYLSASPSASHQGPSKPTRRKNLRHVVFGVLATDDAAPCSHRTPLVPWAHVQRLEHKEPAVIQSAAEAVSHTSPPTANPYD